MSGIVVALVLLGLVDGAFSGFRSSLGRTGLVDHVADDRRGLRRGAVAFVVLAVPAVLSTVIDTTLGRSSATYRAAGMAFLSVVAPYALVVTLALLAYATLRWQLRYLASAMILGPFTLLRPYVVVAAGGVAVVQEPSLGLAVTSALAVAAVLLVEPLLNGAARRTGGATSAGRTP